MVGSGPFEKAFLSERFSLLALWGYFGLGKRLLMLHELRILENAERLTQKVPNYSYFGVIQSKRKMLAVKFNLKYFGKVTVILTDVKT